MDRPGNADGVACYTLQIAFLLQPAASGTSLPRGSRGVRFFDRGQGKRSRRFPDIPFRFAPVSARSGLKDRETMSKKAAPEGAAKIWSVGIFYEVLRRRRPSHPKPISDDPRSVSEAGSGTPRGVGITSPDEYVAVSGPVTVPAARAVSVAPPGRLTVKSIVPVPPTGKSARNVALEMLSAVTVSTALVSNIGVLVPSLMPGHVTVPIIEPVAPLVAVKVKVSVPPVTIGKMPLLSVPVVPDIAPNVVVPVISVLPLGAWKAAGLV